MGLLYLYLTIIHYNLHEVVALRNLQICLWRVTEFRTREVHVNRTSQRCFRFKFVTLVALVSYYPSSSFHDAVERGNSIRGSNFYFDRLYTNRARVSITVYPVSVHPPGKDKMAITPRNNIQIRKLHLTTRSTAPLKKQRDAQLFKKFPSFYGA